MKRVVFDIETDGLLPELTRVHSLVLRDLDTNEVLSCTDDGDPAVYHVIEKGLQVLSQAEVLYGHNAQEFDIPALKKVYPDFSPRGVLRDTLITTRFRWAHIKDSDFKLWKRKVLPPNLIGRHSLKAWGYRLGLHKGEYNGGWERWSPEMQRYCEQDTAVTRALVQKIQRAGVPGEAVGIEHDIAAYLGKQEANGFPFDLQAAQALYAKLKPRQTELEEKLIATFGSWYVNAGEFIPKRDNKRRGLYAGCPSTRIKLVTFKPSSRDHIADRLQKLYGWHPTEFTETGKPKVDEDTLEGLDIPEGPMLVDYFVTSKLLGMLGDGKKAWFKFATPNAATGLYHIHGRINPSGAVTHRASHSEPNIAQVPKVMKAKKDGKEVVLLDREGKFGWESRSLFTVPRGWKLIGADASGLELRCLAHYMAKYDGGDYGRIILEGDIHVANQDAAGLSLRDEAKTFIYAFLYGAGDVKLGSIVLPFGTEEEQRAKGAELRARFLKNLPALGMLVKDVQRRAKKRGYLRLPDKRRVYIRSEHAALNSLLQGAGAIICKAWIQEFDRRMTAQFGPQGWNGQWAALAWVHDEVQFAVREGIADQAVTVPVEAIRSITDRFGWRLPLDGEARIGNKWAETH